MKGKPWAYPLLMVIIGFVAMAATGMWYTSNQLEELETRVSYSQAQELRKFCVVVNISLSQNPRTLPEPETEAGIEARKRQIRGYDAMLQLRKELRCPSIPVPAPTG